LTIGSPGAAARYVRRLLPECGQRKYTDERCQPLPVHFHHSDRRMDENLRHWSILRNGARSKVATAGSGHQNYQNGAEGGRT
jgi:hypothetical protein